VRAGEFETIRRIVDRIGAPPGDVVVGPGDDCAVVDCAGRLLLLTDDALVEDVHFETGMLTLEQLGARAAAVAISDVAAMGGTPRWVLVSAACPPGREDRLERIASGLSGRARSEGAAVVGGNLARARELVLSLAVVGTMERGRPLLRSGASPGDLVAATGTLGGASLGLRSLRGRCGADGVGELIGSWREPPSRTAAGRALVDLASAAIDLSDGLLQDLGHVLDASGVGARLELSRVPLPAGYARAAPDDDPWGPVLHGGEDYELLVTLPPGNLARAAEAVAETGTDLTVIGRIQPAPGGISVIGPDGAVPVPGTGGWDHFRH
jgi:thiamine-monophosphate kinase